MFSLEYMLKRKNEDASLFISAERLCILLGYVNCSLYVNFFFMLPKGVGENRRQHMHSHHPPNIIEATPCSSLLQSSDQKGPYLAIPGMSLLLPSLIHVLLSSNQCYVLFLWLNVILTRKYATVFSQSAHSSGY